MGSRFISKTVEGTSMSLAYEMLRAEEAEKFGDDYYSGRFGSTRLGSTKTLTTGDCTQDVKDIANATIDRECEDGMNNGNVVKGLDLGIVMYNIVTVKKKKVTTKPPKYENGYAIYANLYSKDDKPLKTGKNKTEMEAKLLEYGFEYPDAYLVKQPILVDGNAVVSRLEVVTKTSKTKPTKVPAKAKVIPIHRYAFYGWVSE